jgi:hypothetical protein
MASNRIYLVTVGRVTGPQEDRLIRAKSKAAALAHVAADTIRATLASQDALVGALSAGVAIEDAAAGAYQVPTDE